MNQIASSLMLIGSWAKIIVPTIVVIAFVAFLIGSAMSFACGYRWGTSGMNAKWLWFAGCMVEYEPNRWIPEERFRAIPD